VIVIAKTTTFQTTSKTDVLDITPSILELLPQAGIGQGLAALFVPGSTAALSTIEFEGGAVKDLKTAIERIAPEDGNYEHNLRWGDGNGYSHVRAALLGPSLHIPIINGNLALGTWQQIVLMDFDNRPRERKIIVQFTGVE
jgi:secondary thiamine-phosphate synthase enzyme